MTATEELRRLLDERGVEHFDGTETTLWGYEPTGTGTGVYRIMADEVANGRLVIRMLFKTPEQAIEATLGRGECTDTGRYCFTCSECGWVANEPHHMLGGFWPNYCPCCGRKVKE